jgi:hypothetical protein
VRAGRGESRKRRGRRGKNEEREGRCERRERTGLGELGDGKERSGERRGGERKVGSKGKEGQIDDAKGMVDGEKGKRRNKQIKSSKLQKLSSRIFTHLATLLHMAMQQ